MDSQVRAELKKRPDADALVAAISALQTPRTLQFSSLDLSTLELHVPTDSSCAKNRDLSSQLGYVFLAMSTTDAHCSIGPAESRAESPYPHWRQKCLHCALDLMRASPFTTC